MLVRKAALTGRHEWGGETAVAPRFAARSAIGADVAGVANMGHMAYR